MKLVGVQAKQIPCQFPGPAFLPGFSREAYPTLADFVFFTMYEIQTCDLMNP